ncbi:MAG: CatB-related O-acetyltransferase [Alphaproteobacteria bacterium]|nr:CatB-related O-acetyltransferase [Alphaproteobacteria bacterium]
MSRIGDGSSFEGFNKIGKFSYFQGKIGVFSYIGDNVMVIGGCVGRFSSISSNVHVLNGRHPMKEPFVSTSPVFYAKNTPVGFSFVKEQVFDEYASIAGKEKYQVIIGSDCWIGYGVSIIGGITIGDGAVVLANATVTKDVPPYAIIGGVPARIIGYRFDETTIAKLLELKWWNREESWIKEKAHLFSDIEGFLKLE